MGSGIAVLAVAVCRRHFWRDPAFFLTFSAISVFFFYKTRIVPEHFWSARRFLAVTLPGALLCLAAFADDLVGRDASRHCGSGCDRLTGRTKRRTIAGWRLPARSVWVWG